MQINRRASVSDRVDHHPYRKKRKRRKKKMRRKRKKKEKGRRAGEAGGESRGEEEERERGKPRLCGRESISEGMVRQAVNACRQ